MAPISHKNAFSGLLGIWFSMLVLQAVSNTLCCVDFVDLLPYVLLIGGSLGGGSAAFVFILCELDQVYLNATGLGALLGLAYAIFWGGARWWGGYFMVIAWPTVLVLTLCVLWRWAVDMAFGRDEVVYESERDPLIKRHARDEDIETRGRDGLGKDDCTSSSVTAGSE